MTTDDAMFILGEIKLKVIRKENMRRNLQSSRKAPALSATQKRQLPMLQPDFGMKSNNNSNKPYIFLCSIFAFETILNKLNINI